MFFIVSISGLSQVAHLETKIEHENNSLLSKHETKRSKR